MQLYPPLPRKTAALVRDLLKKKQARDAERAFVVEGIKPIQDILFGRTTTPLTFILTPAFVRKMTPVFARLIARSHAPTYLCAESIVDKISELETSQGILSVVRQPEWDQMTVLRAPQLFGIFGECLQDPANVGGILRTAAALGMDALWLTPDSADPFHPKVVRAAAGALLSIPVFQAADPTVFLTHGCALFSSQASLRGSVSIREVRELPQKVVLAVGNESRGLSETTCRQATVNFHIPLSRGMDSLNVAASAAIAAFHFSGLPRQS